MKPEDVIKEFNTADFAQDWKMASFYLEDYLDYEKVKNFLISTIISIYKEELKEIPEDERMCPIDETRGPEDWKIDECSELINQERNRLRTKLESKIKEWELLGNK